MQKQGRQRCTCQRMSAGASGRVSGFSLGGAFVEKVSRSALAGRPVETDKTPSLLPERGRSAVQGGRGSRLIVEPTARPGMRRAAGRDAGRACAALRISSGGIVSARASIMSRLLCGLLICLLREAAVRVTPAASSTSHHRQRRMSRAVVRRLDRADFGALFDTVPAIR